MVDATIKKCSSCGAEVRSAGVAPFRTGGTSGGWKLIFGEWAELGEQMLSLNIYVCLNCGKIELFTDEKTRQTLLSR